MPGLCAGLFMQEALMANDFTLVVRASCDVLNGFPK
jgi:hypothetical protein